MPRPGNKNFFANKYGCLVLLGGLCLFLSAVEYLIPKPLPFMRLGLANMPLLLGLDILSPGLFFLLAFVKVLGQGIISGTLFSYVFLFSVVGTFSSAAVMYFLRKRLGKKHLGFAGLGCAGAMVSNTVQLVLARYLIFGAGLRYLIPPFIASGFITGITLGIICEVFCRRSRWYALHTGGGTKNNKQRTVNNVQMVSGIGDAPIGTTSSCVFPIELAQREPKKRPPLSKKQVCFSKLSGRWGSGGKKKRFSWNKFFNADELFFTGIIIILMFLFCRSLTGRVLQFVFLFLLALVSGKKINFFLTFIVTAGIVFFNLLVPYGKVLAVFGPLRITQGSLFAGLEKAVTFAGLMMLSASFIKSDLRLPGRAGVLLGESFRTLELLRQREKVIRPGCFFEDIDKMLLETEAACSGKPQDTPLKKPKRDVKKILLLTGIVLFSAALGFWPW